MMLSSRPSSGSTQVETCLGAGLERHGGLLLCSHARASGKSKTPIRIDTSIAKPDPSKFPTSVKIEGAGAAANERVVRKTAKYNQQWTLDDGNKLVIAAMEAGGRWHPDLIEFVKRFFHASCGDDTKTYVYKLKATTQRVSVALRRMTSRALMEMERRAKAYPSVAVGAALPPP